MAWIDTTVIPEHAASLASLYAGARDSDTGEVDNILTIHALHPRGLRAHLALYQAVMAPSKGLPKAEREMIAVVVSAANGCRY